MSDGMKADNSVGNKRRSFGFAEITLYVVAFISIFSLLGVNSFFRSEDRWAEIVREMLLTGDWFHPAIDFVIYFDKPLLSYWLIALTAKLFGSLNEWTLRLPSAICGMVVIWGTVKIFRDLFSRQIGILAGWLTLSCYGFLMWTRSAEADMPQLAMVVLAFLWFMHCRKNAGFMQYWIFYLLLFVGAQLKGLPAIFVPIAAALPFVFFHGEFKRNIKFSHVLAIILALPVFFVAPLLAEYMPMYELYSWPNQLSALDLVWRENIIRVFQPFDHDEPWYVYLYELPRVLIPWSPFFVMALIYFGMKFKKLDADTKALFCTVILIFLMFSFSGSRRWYYILPITPFCMGLTSLFLWERKDDRWLAIVLKVVRWVAVIGASLAVLSLLIWPFWGMLNMAWPTMLLIMIPLLGAIVLVLLILGERSGMEAAEKLCLPAGHWASLLVLAAISIGVMCGVYSSIEKFRSFKPFLIEMHQKYGHLAPERVVFLAYDRNCFLLYFWNYTQPVNVIKQVDPDIVEGSDEHRKEIVGASLKELQAELGRLSAESDEDIVLISFERHMDNYREVGINSIPEFDMNEPTYRETNSFMGKRDKKDFWFWILKPEQIRQIQAQTDGSNAEQ